MESVDGIRRLGRQFMIAADDKELAEGTALLLKGGSSDAPSLLWSLVESHEINRASPAEYKNARRRERLVKTLVQPTMRERPATPRRDEGPVEVR